MRTHSCYCDIGWHFPEFFFGEMTPNIYIKVIENLVTAAFINIYYILFLQFCGT